MAASMSMDVNVEDVHVMVSNIPKEYHSSDLRNFFSQLVETDSFSCFHYRHRPAATAGQEPPLLSTTPSFCCAVKVHGNKLKDFTRMYNGKHWVNSDGDSSPFRCFITRIKVRTETDKGDSVFKTRLEQRTVPRDRVEFTHDDLINLIEMRPPELMPNGNVGTPTSYFIRLIRECRMPAGVIRKLGLVFPTRRGRRIYGSVPFDYGPGLAVVVGASSVDPDDDDVRTARGIPISDRHVSPTRERSSSSNKKPVEEPQSEEDDDDGEEWDRHEALHDDVTEQARDKERLFEEEIELKWEKGGSGLVFYTDAQYWDEQKGDFDERTSDDWDVDYSIYYEKGGGDKDTRDYVQMRHEERLRSGHVNESAFEKKIGRFERHTKGFGRRMMERDGWKDGQGLGSTIEGIAEALENDGQHPRDKRGFGYHGEKLVRFPVKKPRTDVRISTVYDEPSRTDPPEPLLRTGSPTSIKHRVARLK